MSGIYWEELPPIYILVNCLKVAEVSTVQLLGVMTLGALKVYLENNSEANSLWNLYKEQIREAHPHRTGKTQAAIKQDSSDLA